MSKDSEAQKIKGIYLLPNLLTTASLFSGFYAIVASLKGKFEIAAIAIFIAMVFDALDGRVARMTNTQSDFGAQYDSISDMACFGVAPAIIAYSWGLSDLGKIGWICAFIYTAGTALRLARFNSVNDNTAPTPYFVGLPCPSAAALVAALVWIATDFDIPGKKISIIVAAVTVTAGLLMVSNIKYSSFKKIEFRGKVPFVTMLLAVLLYVLVAYDPPKVLFSIFFLYVLSGPACWVKTNFKRIFKKSIKKEN